MKINSIIKDLLVVLIFFGMISCGGNKVFNSIDKLSEAVSKASPGDTLLIADGVYNDVSLLISGEGTSEKPIVITAENSGKVRFEGESNVRIGGKFIELHNLYFTNGFSPNGGVIEFRLDDKVADNCRITGCVIENYNPADRSSKNPWIVFYGKNNRFDHNTIFGKQNGEATLIVELDEERNRENNHIIEHNLFGKRPNYGSNGAETIRVGNSTYSLTASKTQIVNNWFEHCDGEVEHVSIKSGENFIARNVFYECAGELVLRHGNGNTVEGNVMIGNRKPHTGGIRIVNENQIVRRNYLQGLTGKRFYASLAVMNGVPNPLINRYHQVKNTQITENIFVDCDNIEFGVGKDNERTLPAVATAFTNNIIINKNANQPFIQHDDVSGIRFEGNQINISKAVSVSGFTSENIEIPAMVLPVEKKDCGAPWFVYDETEEATESKKIPVDADEKSIIEAIDRAQPNDTIEVKYKDEIAVNQPIVINKPLVIISNSSNGKNPVLRYSGTKSQQPIIQIADNGKLRIKGFDFSGSQFEGKPKPNAGISPAPVMRGTYSAFMEDCNFYNFEESSFAGYRALKNTFADSLVFVNCNFSNISGEGIGLGAEKDDTGKYSAENILIENCHFEKILGASVNIYRGGNDESTTGPTVVIKNSKVVDSSNQERGSAFRLIGTQTADIENVTFVNSGKGGASIKFDECWWDDISVKNVSYTNSGKIRRNKAP